MGIDRHVPRCTTQTLALAIRNVLLRFRIPVLLCHSEIDHVNDIGGFSPWTSNQEIVGFDIPVDEILVVYRLNAR